MLKLSPTLGHVWSRFGTTSAPANSEWAGQLSSLQLKANALAYAISRALDEGCSGRASDRAFGRSQAVGGLPKRRTSGDITSGLEMGQTGEG